MNKNLKHLTVLRNLLSDKIISNIDNYSPDDDGLYIFLSAIYEKGAENNLLGYICEKITYDENAFAIACAHDKAPSKHLKDAYMNDLKIIFDALNSMDENGFSKGTLAYPFNSKTSLNANVNKLMHFYNQFGFGQFIYSMAFSYEEGKLIPIQNTSKITCEELKNYEYEKKLISDNIFNFVNRLPYSNMLLYGDRGTGKSSTVHAMLNKYFEDGLRIIELNKENMLDIPKIRQLISDNPLKFIIFIDDLSLGEYDDKVSSLKASLEGSVSGGANNVMIVATSNRRHIVKESFSDRENSIHPADSMAEQLSLSDRFGLTVNFSTTDKQNYLSIIEQLAEDAHLKIDKDSLFAIAERWALVKGGRSPRRARQLIDLIIASENRGIDVDF